MKGIRYLAAALVLAGAGGAFAQDGKPAEKRTDYIRRLYARDRATFGDACRVFASLVRDEPAGEDFAALLKDLRERGIVDPGWEFGEASAVRKGEIGYMLVKALGIKGGLTMSLFGVSRRYALRECVFIGLVSKGSALKRVSGRELLDILAMAVIYKKEGTLKSVRK